MVADIAIVLIVVLFILIGIKRGLARTFFNLVGLVVTAIAAYYASGFVAEFIYNTFMKQSVITNIQQTITQSGVNTAFYNCFDSLPSWISSAINGVLGLFGTDSSVLLNGVAVPENVASTAATSIESVVGKCATDFMALILVIILFIIIFIIVKWIISKILLIFNIPVIKQVNKSLGGVFGAIEGIAFVWIAVNVFYIVMYFANPDIINNSLTTGSLFKLLCIAI